MILCITLGKTFIFFPPPLPQIVLCFASNFLEIQLEERIALCEIPEKLAEKPKTGRLI